MRIVFKFKQEHVMKKIFSLLISVILLGMSLCSCSGFEKNERYTIVTTVFSEYDWVMNILGDRAESYDVRLLTGNGVDLHSYQPTAADLTLISDCDMFIYVGGESDGWVEHALSSSRNPDQIAISLMEVMGDRLFEEEVTEGMEAEEEEGEGPVYDEHVWLSLKNAQVFCQEISDRLCEAVPGDADIISENTEHYLSKLSELDGLYQQAVDEAPGDTLIFADRFPFRYLVEDYDLNYYAAFPGCSAESEASFDTVLFLAEKTDELDIGYLLVIDGQEGDIAGSVINNTAEKDQTVLVLDSLQSVTDEDIQGGTSYISVMTEDLEVLKTALS